MRHVDYIHYNPVKHGLVTDPDKWPYSTYRKYHDAGLYPADWATRYAQASETGIGGE